MKRSLKAIRQGNKKKTKIKLSTNTILRMSERFREIHQKIKSKKFGRFFVEGDYNYGRLHKITQGWRSNVKLLCYFRWWYSFSRSSFVVC